MSLNLQLEEGRAGQVPRELGEPTSLRLLFSSISNVYFWFLTVLNEPIRFITRIMMSSPYSQTEVSISSPYSQTEEGSAEQDTGERNESTRLWPLFSSIGKILKRFLREIANVFFWFLVAILITISWIYEQIKFIIKIMMKYVIKTVVKVAIKKKIFLLLSVVSIILDPLFFYIPVMNDEKKCIAMDRVLASTVTVLRSVFDLLKIINFIYDLLTQLRVNRRKRAWLFFLIDIFATLPLPQVIVNLQGIRGTDILYAMSLSLLQYSVRVIRTIYLFTEATGVSGILAEAPWAIVGFNILLYMQGSHVFGALWYFYAIAKVTACWKKACINQPGCAHSSFVCEHTSSEDKSFLNDFCGISTRNTTSNNFGLYNDALESGIVEEMDFPKKLLHCLQWGLQNLSGFGQNLQTSTDIWENVFVICMTTFGVVLFVFLIGKMQYDIARSQKIRKRWNEVKQWPNFEDISSDVQGQLRKYMREKWRETKHVDVHSLLTDLPNDLGNKIKRQLCIKLLRNVNEFENWSEISLRYLCEFLNPVYFTKRTRIIREGDPIDEMLFVLNGKLWTYTSRNEITTTSNRRCRRNYLRDGDFFGRELIEWAQNDSSSNLPTATKTIQALTDVEAFTLGADDLKHVLSLRHFDQPALLLQTYWRFRRFLRDKRKAEQKSQFRKVLDWAAKELH